jgi:hypothetical protein
MGEEAWSVEDRVSWDLLAEGHRIWEMLQEVEKAHLLEEIQAWEVFQPVFLRQRRELGEFAAVD